jgi:Kelch motif
MVVSGKHALRCLCTSRTGYGGAEREAVCPRRLRSGWYFHCYRGGLQSGYKHVDFRARASLRGQSHAAAVAGGQLYSFGAGAGETFVYNPNNNSWVARASSHYVHSRTAAVGVIDNKIYVAGGMGTPSQRELEVYDPVANTWTVRAPMSVPRNHSAGGVINGKFYVAGGRLTTVASSTNVIFLGTSSFVSCRN